MRISDDEIDAMIAEASDDCKYYFAAYREASRWKRRMSIAIAENISFSRDAFRRANRLRHALVELKSRRNAFSNGVRRVSAE